MASDTFVVIDLETTGLDPQLEGILEIAAVRLVDGAVTDRWQTLVRPAPGVTISAASFAIHGIGPELVAEAPPLDAVLPEFLAFVGDAPLVAHNAPFDMAFLGKALALAGRPPLPNAVFDSLDMAREVFPEQRSHRLEALCRLFGHHADGFHRASADVAHLAAVFPRLVALWREKQAWYQAQFGQVEHLARRFDQVTRLVESLQLELGEIRRVLGAYFAEHPDARVPLVGGDALVRTSRETYDYDPVALLPLLDAWGLRDRLVKIDRQRLERWIAAGRFTPDQLQALQDARLLASVSHRFGRADAGAVTAESRES